MSLTIKLPKATIKVQIEDQNRTYLEFKSATHLHPIDFPTTAGGLGSQPARSLFIQAPWGPMETLAEYNVSLINYPADELDEDIKNARRHSI